MATDDLREAMATVREYWGRKFVDPDKYEDGCELLARWLVANAGELAESVRRIKTNVFDAGGYIGPGKLGRLFTTEGTEVFDSLMFDARRLAAALEPLLGEGGK
jgi:hypothetical protein